MWIKPDPPVSSLLKFCHKFFIDPVLDPKGQFSAQEQLFLVEHPLSIPQIKDQQIVLAGFKGRELLTLQIRLEIVKKDEIFPDSIDSHLVRHPQRQCPLIAAPPFP